MPLGDMIGEMVAQSIVEPIAYAIRRKAGWVGCAVAIVIVLAIVGSVGLAIWTYW